VTSRERLLAALACKTADRLPATTHHVLPAYLEKYLPGKSNQGFFDEFGLDAIT